MMGFNDMMSGWGGLAGWTAYVAMFAFWATVLSLVVWALWRSIAPNPNAPLGDQPPAESAEDILKRRYVAGEIDRPEFERKRRDLLYPEPERR